MKKLVFTLICVIFALRGTVSAQDTTNTSVEMKFQSAKISTVFEPRNYSSADKEKLRTTKRPFYFISGTTTIIRKGDPVKIPVVSPITLNGGSRIRVRLGTYGGPLEDERIEIIYLPAQFEIKKDDFVSIYKITYPGGFIYIATPLDYFK